MNGDNWTTIGEIADVFDGPHATPEKIGSGPLFLSISSLKDGTLDLSESAHISEKDFVKWTRRVTPKQDDIVFSYETRLGDAAIIPKGLKCCLGRRMGLLRVKLDKVIPEYLLYSYLGPTFQALIKARTIHGSTVDRISIRDLPNFPIQIPPIEEQLICVSVLKSIDGKIALNRQINQTLEAMAHALFKSWFVDFEPVRAQAAALEPGEDPTRVAMRVISGKTDDELDTLQTTDAAAYAQLQTTASLFPDEFEESELGLVPKGWEIKTVGAILDKIFSGGTPDTREAQYWNGDLPWFSSGETRQQLIIKTEKFITKEGAKESSTKVSLRGDILIASAGQGYTRGQTSYNLISTYINQSVVAIRVNQAKASSLWLYKNLSTRYEEMRSLSDSHSSRGSLTTKLLAGMPLVLPQKELIDYYTLIVESYLLNQEKNEIENLRLSELRNILLPKLLSGELSVSNSEAEADTIA